MFRYLSGSFILAAAFSSVAVSSAGAQSPPIKPNVPPNLKITLLPDLVVRSMTQDSTGTVRVMVWNEGGFTSGPCTLRIRLLNAAGATTGLRFNSVPSMAPDIGALFTLPAASLPPGTRMVVATIDSLNSVPEMNELNNTSTFALPNRP